MAFVSVQTNAIGLFRMRTLAEWRRSLGEKHKILSKIGETLMTWNDLGGDQEMAKI